MGPVFKLLREIQGPLGLVFLNADKKGLIAYYELLIPLLPVGGILLVDNILWSGKVVEELATNDKDTKAILALNKHINNDPRVEQVILSVRDGIMMVRKI